VAGGGRRTRHGCRPRCTTGARQATVREWPADVAPLGAVFVFESAVSAIERGTLREAGVYRPVHWPTRLRRAPTARARQESSRSRPTGVTCRRHGADHPARGFHLTVEVDVDARRGRLALGRARRRLADAGRPTGRGTARRTRRRGMGARWESRPRARSSALPGRCRSARRRRRGDAARLRRRPQLRRDLP
jgi:hypothetical protein